MIRKAFIMQVNPDAHEEYQRRHNPIWPELEAVLKSHGAHNYAIYLDKAGNDSNLLIVFYVQIMPDDFVMQLHR
ncbi:L-rhamnose mutarotase, partial [Escherichia coli]